MNSSFLTIVHFINVNFLWWVLNHIGITSFVTLTSLLTISFWVPLSRTMIFNLPPFGSCLINWSIPKREIFVFKITYSKASKTRASGFPVEESNVATVIAMNWRRASFFLIAEFLFLCYSGWSVYNEYILKVIILV